IAGIAAVEEIDRAVEDDLRRPVWAGELRPRGSRPEELLLEEEEVDGRRQLDLRAELERPVGERKVELRRRAGPELPGGDVDAGVGDDGSRRGRRPGEERVAFVGGEPERSDVPGRQALRR